MVDPIRLAGQARHVPAYAPETLAQRLIAAHTGRVGHDLPALQREVAILKASNPAMGQEVERLVHARLTPVEQGQWAHTAAPATGAATARTGTPPATDYGKLGLDVTQMALDVVGIFEPTPFADGANTLISLGRGDGWGALASAAGIIPYVGDLAKLGKLGKWAKTVAEATELVAHNPAARRAIEPALKKLSEALHAIPDGALKKLPQDAREALTKMRGQLDEALGMGSRKLSDIPVGELSRKTILDKLDTLDVATKPNTAIFYSGRGAREAAEKNAAATGRATLETTAGGKHLDDMKLFENTVPDVNGDAAMEIWGKVSTRYAEEASGKVAAFVNNPRPTSVFLTQELPALLANKKVSEIVVRGGSGAEVTIARGTKLDDALAAIATLK